MTFKMKAFYDTDGISPPILVEILAWDGDKYVQYQNEAGEIGYDKLWKLGVKRSNRWYKTPEYDWDGKLKTFSNKDIAKMLKQRRKRKIEYLTWKGDTKVKAFKNLKKALNFCVSGHCDSLSYCVDYKQGFSSGPVLEKENDLWYYFTCQHFVSEVTLNKFCSP